MPRLRNTVPYPPSKFSAQKGPTKPRNANSRFIRRHEKTTGESTVQTRLCRPVICRLDICRPATCRPEIKYLNQTETLSENENFLPKTVRTSRKGLYLSKMPAPMISNYSPTRKTVNALNMSGMLIVIKPIVFEDFTHQNRKQDSCY